jgi:hydrogenase maturation protein HypF
MLESGANSPQTSSAGRLFDAVASIVGLRHVNHFEGQAAMELEFQIGDTDTPDTYDIALREAGDDTLIVDWEPIIRGIIDDVRSGAARPLVAARFHNTMAAAIVAVAGRIGESSVVLSGGCFQNRYLTEKAIDGLQEAGFKPYWHQRIPANDGGIALGQIAAADRHFFEG